MYTVVKKTEIAGHRTKGDRPSLEVIDHRKKYQGNPYEDSYEKLRQQREALLDAEMRYQRRIRELEKESADVAKAQEATQTENKSLKNFLNRGPKATNVKKVKLENNQLQDVVKKLHDENRDLVKLINRMEKRDQEEWQDAFEETRRRQEQRYSVFGPFVAGLNGKKSTITLNDPKEKNVSDNYDRELMKLSKQTKTLLHKFEQMKRVKGDIDFATVMGPTQKCTSNVVKHRAIGDKLNLDLNKYSSRLEELTAKHESMTEVLIESLSTEGEKTPKRAIKPMALPAVESKQELRNGQQRGSQNKRTNKGMSNDNESEMKVTQKQNTIKDKSGAVSAFITEIPVSKTMPNRRISLGESETDDNEHGYRVKKNKRVNSVTPNKLQNKTTGKDITGKAQNSKLVKSASSAASEGILKAQDNLKKDTNVRFQKYSEDSQDQIKPKLKTTAKSSIEETWDHQRVKMNATQQSARKRPASKSASTVRKRSVETIKIKSELAHYNDHEDIADIKREVKIKRILDKDTDRSNRVEHWSPLLFESTLKQISANDVGLKPKADTAKGVKVPRLSINQKQGLKLNNYSIEDNPNSTGRYTHGPESIKDTNNMLAMIEGPDSKRNKAQSNVKVESDSRRRSRSNANYGLGNESLTTGNKPLDLDLTKSGYDNFIRRENKLGGAKTNVSKTEMKSAKSSAKSPRSFPKHPPISKDSIHLERAPNSKVVLNYLKHNSGGSPVDFNVNFVDTDEYLRSPAPVMFREDARTLGRRHIRFVSRTDHLRPEIDHRRGEYYRSYLNDND